MIRKMLPILLLAALSMGAVLRLGPSVRYMVFGSSTLSEAGSVTYGAAVSRMLFQDSHLFIPGFAARVPVGFGLDLDLGVHWCHYDPKYVILPDSAAYPMNRRGSISVFDLGIRREFRGFYVIPGAELQYFSEEWSDPYDGSHMSIDSVAVGPSLCAGSEIDLSLFSLRLEMGLVFPGLSDVQLRMDLSALIP